LVAIRPPCKVANREGDGNSEAANDPVRNATDISSKGKCEISIS